MERSIAAVLLLLPLLAGCASLAPDDPPPPPEYAALPLVEGKSDIRPPRVIQRVDPSTPEGMAGRDTSARVEVVVDATGHVEAAWLLSGDPVWGEAVLDAVRQWTFDPATKEGRPIAVRFRIKSDYSSRRLF